MHTLVSHVLVKHPAEMHPAEMHTWERRRQKAPRKHLTLTAFLLLTIALTTRQTVAQDEDDQALASQQLTPVAWIDDQPVYITDVEPAVESIAKNRNLSGRELAMIRATSLEQIIGQRLILQYLETEGGGASDDDLKLAKARLIEQLDRFQRKSLNQYLKEQGITEGQLDLRLAWRIGWQNYLDKYLSEQNLTDFYNRNRKDFDGTQLHGWQIFLPLEKDSTEKEQMEKINRLQQARLKITNGEDSFEDVARSLSEAPTAETGGDLGWVDRRQSLPESVAKTLYSVDKNSISDPIVSSYGVHIVRWTEEKPGKKSLEEVSTEVKLAATQFLFEWIVKQQRPKVKIGYSPDYPHFKSGSTELVIPNANN